MDGRRAGTNGGTPELFFCRDLEGYGWCVRKGDYLNVGIGRRTSVDFNSHVQDFMAFLERTDTLRPASDLKWRGHAYLAAGAGIRPLVDDGMLLVGDAAGLAYAESGEGIGPAIESGRLAAETLIALNGRARAADLQPYADALMKRHPRTSATPAALKPSVAALGRLLLGSATFARHIVLNRRLRRPASGAGRAPSGSHGPSPRGSIRLSSSRSRLVRVKVAALTCTFGLPGRT